MKTADELREHGHKQAHSPEWGPEPPAWATAMTEADWVAESHMTTHKPYYSEAGITIYHGDCFDILPNLSGIGAIVTDPPYSSGGQFRGDRIQRTITKYVQTGAELGMRSDFHGDSRDQRSFLVWCSLWLTACFHASDPKAIAISFTDWRQLPTMTDALQCAGWTWRGIGTWHKPGIRMQRGRFSGSAEFLAWGTKGSWEDHDGAPQNVFACPPVADKAHIAEKPVEVVNWAIGAVSRDVVILDPFMGSGTTLEAAKARHQRAIGIELSEGDCEFAAKRLSQQVLDFA